MVYAVKREMRHGDKHLWDEVSFWCPGCDSIHRVAVPGGNPPDGRHVWQWNGALDNTLTVTPSILAYSSAHLCEGEHGVRECTDPDCESVSHRLGHRLPDGTVDWNWRSSSTEEWDVRGHGEPHTRDPAWGNCHSFLRNGVWEFLSDSAHHLAGKSVPMVPLPDWYVLR